eukprot:SM000127S26624  [mRNA]  locus=s127:102933:103542:+ [translate_table: standard]
MAAALARAPALAPGAVPAAVAAALGVAAGGCGLALAGEEGRCSVPSLGLALGPRFFGGPVGGGDDVVTVCRREGHRRYMIINDIGLYEDFEHFMTT